MTFLILLLITAGLAVFLLKRKASGAHHPAQKHAPVQRRAAKTGAADLQAATETDYRATSLLAPANACSAAKKISGTRFLVSDAPVIPLKDCDRLADCHCTFKKYDDRRSQDDRRNHNYAVNRIRGNEKEISERREETDRRKADDEDLDIFGLK